MDYRETLQDGVELLEYFENRVFTIMVNLAMNGELSSIDELFEEGDALTFKECDFEKLDDVNIARLLKLYHTVIELRESLININKLKDENTENGDEMDF